MEIIVGLSGKNGQTAPVYLPGSSAGRGNAQDKLVFPTCN